MADTTKTVKSSGGDYSSLSAWEAGQQKSISAGDREIAECYAMSDTTLVVIDGWTTVATGTILIKAHSTGRHAGVWDTGKYNLVASTSYAGVIKISENYVAIEGIQLRNTNTSTEAQYGIELTTSVDGGLIRIEGCLLRGTNSGGTASQGVAIFSVNATHTQVINNVLYDWQDAVYTSYGTGYASKVVTLYNNTIRDSTRYGIIVQGGATLNFKNNIIQGSATADYSTEGFSTINSATNITSDATSPQSGLRNITLTFNNAAGDDFSLASSDTQAIDAGTDLSGDSVYAFSTDILGTTRSGTWEVGAFNYAAAAGGQPSMRRFGGTPGMTPGPQSFGRSW